ncbi:hypothetical protein [uncultured Gimesia sp.]|uniref:hypothetical protein n=2 Tax=Gimesia TaxID=1649453 RepID=UPI000E8EC984|nr:hypothetical protein [Planctomycetaceae bacterium]HBL48435.1 hypothetical protein [Planctomycetaceae bacterium]
MSTIFKLRMIQFYPVFLFLLFLPIFTGCGNQGSAGPEIAAVKGTVSLDGDSIPVGDIIFEPADGAGPAAAGQIREGKFELQCPVGTKKVIISAARKTGKKGKDFGEDIMESYIPAKYNTETELLEKVSPDTENEFHFALKSM